MGYVLGSFLVFVGLFSVAGGILNWDWFFADRKAKPIVRSFGRTGARIFYVIIGLAVMTLGIIGFPPPPSGAN
jgi:predicted transporter